MGAKSAIKRRKRGVAFKCNLCGRKLMTSNALVAHKSNVHNIVTKRRGRPPQTHNTVKIDKAFSKDVHSEIATPSKRAPKLAGTTKMKESTVEFECPKCFKRFPTYFPARKHIQKYHCVDTQNYAVSPYHPNLIEPVRLELCIKCMQKVKSIDTHECEDPLKQNEEQRLLLCAACEQWFPNSNLFNSHVAGMHAEPVESMFFPNMMEFTNWKTDMEHQTKTRYNVSEQDNISKQHYLCNCRRSSPGRPNTSYICPSTIIRQELPNGFQVHFYQKHYKHAAAVYRLPTKYKKYSITSFLKSSEDYNSLVHLKPDEDDLYMQFKSLMEGIVVDAAKINIATLKIILGKALEITSILTNYDEELDDVPIRNPKKIMLEDQITKALEDPLAKMKAMDPTNVTVAIGGNSIDMKRKNTDVETITDDIPEKRPKLEDNLGKTVNKIDPPLKIVNSFSLADAVKNCKIAKVVTENIAVNKVSDEPKIDTDNGKKLKVNGEPSSFADSYKDFVVRNFPNMESVASRTRSKPILKTRIGEFKPNDAKIYDKSKPIPNDPKIYDKSKPIPNDAKIYEKPKPIPNDPKIYDKSKPIPIAPKIVDSKPKSVLAVSTNAVEIKTDLLKNALEKTRSVLISTATVDNKAKSVSFSPKIVDSKAKSVSFTPKILGNKSKSVSFSPKILGNKAKSVSFSPKILGNKAKSVSFSPKIVDNKAKSVTFSPKTVDDKANPVLFSTTIIEDKTKVLPRIDVKIGTDLKESPNTRGKSHDHTSKLVSTKARILDRKNSRASFDKPKVDLDYEVKEQANDCNILILKI